MTIPDLPFSTAEYDRRLAKARAAMEADGVDILIGDTGPARPFCTVPRKLLVRD